MYSMHAAVNRQVKNRAALSIWSVTTRIVTIKMYIWGISWCNTHTHRDPIRQWHRNESEAKRWTFFCWWCPSTFLALQVQLVVLVSAFVMTVWSVSRLLFFYSRCPLGLCPSAICKSGVHVPRALWSRRRCYSSKATVRIIAVPLSARTLHCSELVE